MQQADERISEPYNKVFSDWHSLNFILSFRSVSMKIKKTDIRISIVRIVQLQLTLIAVFLTN